MAVSGYQDLIAWQLAEQLKLEAFSLLRLSARASDDFRFATQLREAARGPAKHITEGFARFSPRSFMLYLDYAPGSIAETEEHLKDGIELGYFTAQACDTAFRRARRCTTASSRLKQSQTRFRPRPKTGPEQSGHRKPPRGASGRGGEPA